VANLDDGAALSRLLDGVDAVLHAAGPFVETSKPMVDACLATGTHYLDITGEIPVFEAAYARDEAARRQQIVLMPGVGFDVVPTDCLARHLADLMPDAWSLDIALATAAQPSAGTAKSAARGLLRGGLARRDGRLEAYPLGRGVRTVRFPDRERLVMPIPWGDLASAWRSTRIPNVTTYAALPPKAIRAMKSFGWLASASLPLLRPLIEDTPLQATIDAWIERKVHGPDAQEQQAGTSYIWASVSDRQGRTKQATLQTVGGYPFTAMSAVAAVAGVLASHQSGDLTPSQAFGADFVLTIPGSERQDLPASR
jgi:short subunit dehydrogenase-like uncharacterized protein